MRRTPQGPWFSFVVILVASSSFARGRIASGAVSVGDSKRQFERRLCFGETDESGCRENILCWWIAAKDECLSLTTDNGFFIGAGDAGLEFDAPDEISQDRCSYFVTESVCQRDSSCMWTGSCIPVASLAESESAEESGDIPPTQSPNTPEPTSLSPTASAPISLNPTQLQPVPTSHPTTLKPTTSSPTTSISATNIEQSL
ncbi:hypothetical protein THAOC_18996 [Thalassiosira oceanica]|uniref:Apple domain-containing protein n=1 Tax=Thalassiosira oceanica TaxID=159749 RepID=K0SQJ3_THAOC|nr:hypothetical protein THAOC_18996 [Thalassiosira oceanica]|eukprot:EJK60612.1 hypothetical protein THAOC_18996 [Thalassiosira oceanica]